jgi:hypothetical protein
LNGQHESRGMREKKKKTANDTQSPKPLYAPPHMEEGATMLPIWSWKLMFATG